MLVVRLIAVILPLALAAPAAAATIPVTSTADTGAGSLRAAIAAAPAGPTTISLPAGTITLQTPLTVTAKSLTIVGQGPSASAISGGAATRIMDVTDTSSVAFSQLTLENGSDTTAAVVDAPGGATLSLDHGDLRDNRSAVNANGGGDFLLTGGSLALSSGTVAGNVAGGTGETVAGGIVSAQNASVSATDETFVGNAAGGGASTGKAIGGLILVTDTAAPNTTMTLTRVVASDNTAGGAGAPGSGLFSGSDVDVTATGSTFTNNTLGGGGTTGDGFGVIQVSATAARTTRVTLTGSRVTGNHVGAGANGTGGAIAASAGATGAALTVNVTSSLIAANVVGGGAGTGFGGAVETDAGGASATSTVHVASSTLADNAVGAGFSGVGGGLAVGSGGTSSSGTLTIDDSTIADNAAASSAAHDGYGGAIEVDHAIALSINHATIAGDHVDGPKGHGGAIFAAAATLSSSIVAGNSASDHDNCFAAYTSLGHDLDSADECGFTAAGDLRNTDPELAPLGDYGGPLPTRALLVSSPAANAAGACGGVDERGVARPQGPQCDIGAVEAALPPAPVTTAPVGVTPRTATLTGSIAPIADPVAATFDTGPTTAYATSLAGVVGAGLTVTGPIAGLVRRTTYHARLDATTAAGTVHGNDVAFTTPAPVATVSHFRIAPTAFAPAAVARGVRVARAKRVVAGASFRFTASDQGGASVAISHTAAGRRSGRACVKATRRLRRHKACVRTLLDGSVHFRVAKAGAVDYPFAGRIGRRALAAASYTARLTLLADAAPASSAPASARFTVRRR